MTAQQGSLPLSGIRVLDLTRVRSGPTAVRQLADWGADVIKVEMPEGPESADPLGGPREGSDFQNLQRNKRSMTLDLKSPRGIEVFRRLAAETDVVVENFRPDVKDRLGIDYESLKALNPGIILASISGFGQDGPYRDRPGFDQIAQGMGVSIKVERNLATQAIVSSLVGNPVVVHPIMKQSVTKCAFSFCLICYIAFNATPRPS